MSYKNKYIKYKTKNEKLEKKIYEYIEKNNIDIKNVYNLVNSKNDDDYDDEEDKEYNNYILLKKKKMDDEASVFMELYKI